MLLYAISLYTDGNHKLIRWRMVVHGGIDGYTRMIIYLGCSTNNQATTVYRLYALHYVYVARLNHTLKVFQDGWNHHGIRTQSHFSPQLLFVQGALRLRLSGLVAFDFFENVSDDYSVSVDDPPVLESDSVTVPEGQFHLQPEELAELQDSIKESDNYVIDLYLAVPDFIHARYPHT